ncbi:hypothetical protein AB0I99_00205 [Streptomyces spongiicola]
MGAEGDMVEALVGCGSTHGGALLAVVCAVVCVFVCAVVRVVVC